MPQHISPNLRNHQFHLVKFTSPVQSHWLVRRSKETLRALHFFFSLSENDVKESRCVSGTYLDVHGLDGRGSAGVCKLLGDTQHDTVELSAKPSPLDEFNLAINSRNNLESDDKNHLCLSDFQYHSQ